MALHWKVDECAAYHDHVRLRGWCFHAPSPITKVEAVIPESAVAVPVTSFGRASADVAMAIDPAATHNRFDEWLALPAGAAGRDFQLRFTLADGSQVFGESVLTSAAADDPYYLCWEHFIEALARFERGTVLEIGSRARSAITRRDRIPKNLDYVGLDILAGPNVDVVGDAHELEKLFGRGRFVAAFSLSVFEHLAMPWKVALELNRVLAPGGVVFTSTHQTYPLHEEPWDFWRFSRHSWQTLFNAATGFEIVEAVQGEPARIYAQRTNPVTRSLPENPAWLGSASLVRKISDTQLFWPVPLATAASGMYPGGELFKPPQ